MIQARKKTLEVKATIVYEKTVAQGDKRIIIHQGASRSSKTWSIFQYFIFKAMAGERFVLTIARSKLTWIKSTLLKDFEELIEMYGLKGYLNQELNPNRPEQVYKLNGSEFAFFGLDYPQKLHGRKQDYAWLNEIMEIDKGSFNQIEMRTEKQLILDFNPAFDDHWVYELEKRPDVVFIHSSFLDNPFLEKRIADKIRSYEPTQENIEKGTADTYMWEVYGLGRKARLQGAVYTNWSLAEKIPEEAELLGLGLDFGFTCVEENSVIAVQGGDKKIKDIVVGDLVLTRNGYKRVSSVRNMGYKQVYELDFGYGRIKVTGDHRIFTEKGWKPVNKLSGEEILCLQKSSLMGRDIEDTLGLSTKITSSLAMERKQGFTEISTSFTRGISQRATRYITRILTHLITTLRILLQFLIGNTTDCIMRQEMGWGNSQRRKWWNTGQKMGTGKITGKKEEKRQWKQLGKELRSVWSVEKTLPPQMCIKGFAVQDVEKGQTQGIVPESMCAKTVERDSLRQPTLKESHVLKSVPISFQEEKEKQRVFDISVEGEREFFANGLLVHNCDPTAIIELYRFNGELYINELVYERGLLNNEIAQKLRDLGIKNELIVGDSAEPKSIEELKREGFNIEGAIKGAGSVKYRIDLLKQYKMNITKKSINVESELRKYKWKEDRLGKALNEPVDEFNHSLDALAYIGSRKLRREPSMKELAVSGKIEHVQNISIGISYSREDLVWVAFGVDWSGGEVIGVGEGEGDIEGLEEFIKKLRKRGNVTLVGITSEPALKEVVRSTGMRGVVVKSDEKTGAGRIQLLVSSDRIVFSNEQLKLREEIKEYLYRMENKGSVEDLRYAQAMRLSLMSMWSVVSKIVRITKKDKPDVSGFLRTPSEQV